MAACFYAFIERISGGLEPREYSSIHGLYWACDTRIKVAGYHTEATSCWDELEELRTTESVLRI
ncbi:hypothetical protein [Candidatus Methanodesulfokora washburnensis]|uniref:hypothetical protein n=1 Tax=Candidatus Methanodesulfokora washburnensis TaxID=2478471 RepID=UPI000F793FBA|nr:hypothetical protein [Candidatus Methanodesulfokores washburnensis]